MFEVHLAYGFSSPLFTKFKTPLSSNLSVSVSSDFSDFSDFSDSLVSSFLGSFLKDISTSLNPNDSSLPL